MSVFKRQLPAKKDGSIAIRFVATVGSGPDRQRKNFERERDAKAWEAETTANLNSGYLAAAGQKSTVAEFIPIYLDRMRKRCDRGERVTKSYLEGIESICRNYILAEETPGPLPKGSRRIPFRKGIGRLKIGAVTPARVEQFKEDLRDGGMSIAHTRGVLRVGHAAFAYAILKGKVRINPFSGVKVIGHRDEGSEPIIPPMPDFVRELLSKDSVHRELFITLTATGMRVSEAFALRWKHISWTNSSVSIVTRVDDKKREESYGTKSRAGRRKVPLAASVLEMLRHRRTTSAFPSDDDLVFPSQTGTYLSQGNVRKRHLQRLILQVNAERAPEDRYEGSAGFHILRHFAISSWIAKNLPPKTVQTYAGHSTIQVTMDRYGHLFPDAGQQIAIDSIATDIGLGS